ncbi:MAG TPA: LPS export ABC transporter periplasmic protein LptC, partial [Elusimicrobiota bacterium]|nr:LPS export ABC transporter periplasmic protein LptC [Elusimicrobiota bacterium]
MQELESFSLVQTVRGVPSWRLSAPSARIAPSGEASLEKPVMHFFQGRQAVSADESQADSSGSARTAEVRASGDVDLLGDVVVASRVEKSTLRTEKLRYDSKRR